MKWLAAAAAVVVVALGVLLWMATRDDAHADHGEAQPVAAGGTDGSAAAGSSRKPIIPPRPVTTADAAPADDEPAYDAEPGVFVAGGEEMWDHVDETYSRRWEALVADCYTGGEDLSAKIKFRYQLTVTNHVVSMRNIQLIESTIKNKTIEECFLRAFGSVHFEDKQMPDYTTPDKAPEQMMMRVENLKRFLPKQENGMK